jgi:glycosyltransferase involved in cell wall biosynthesis
MISICVPLRHGHYINEVLDSIFNSTFKNFEVIISNASSDKKISEILNTYKVKEIVVPEDTGLLMGRMIPHKAASGEYELLLDETRIISKDLLQLLDGLNYDMVAIGEKEIVKNYWSYLADFDKGKISKIYDPLVNGYIMPRYYKKQILDIVFKNIEFKIPDNLLNKIVYGDHHIIFYEAYKISQNVFYLKDKLIMHYGDYSLREIIKKYHRYGYSSRILIGTPYEFVFKYSSHKRKEADLKTKVKMLPLFLARGIPFLIGRIGI